MENTRLHKKYSVSEFKELLSTPDYEPKILMRDVIKPAVEEINKSGAFKNLRCEVIHAKSVDAQLRGTFSGSIWKTSVDRFLSPIWKNLMRSLME